MFYHTTDMSLSSLRQTGRRFNFERFGLSDKEVFYRNRPLTDCQGSLDYRGCGNIAKSAIVAALQSNRDGRGWIKHWRFTKGCGK